jgi:serine/threonine-protein kinase
MATNRPEKISRVMPQLPNYEILEVIGKGGMATVYRAVQKTLSRVVAIKELKESLQSESTPIKRFEREAITASAMSHENIVSIYDFFEQDDNRYLVMEYVGGTDLATVMSRCKSLPIDIATMIVLQVVRALEYIHATGLVHRDIKPGNIMITHGGVVKLMDFGVVLTPDWETLTMPGTFVGTPRYMSPEQIKGAVVDFRSDLFSIGIIFYELVTGRQLFDANDKTEIFYKITRAVIRRPVRTRAGLPWEISRAIRRCLRRDPRKRYPTTQELRRALENFLGNQSLLTMRQRLVDFLSEEKILTSKTPDMVTGQHRVARQRPKGDFFLSWLVGAERYGFVRSMILCNLLALLTGFFLWWQNPDVLVEQDLEKMAGLKVVATPWAMVYVDGKLRDVTPFDRPIALHEGYHRIVLKHPKFGDRTYELPMRKGELITLPIAFDSFVDKGSGK